MKNLDFYLKIELFSCCIGFIKKHFKCSFLKLEEKNLIFLTISLTRPKIKKNLLPSFIFVQCILFSNKNYKKSSYIFFFLNFKCKSKLNLLFFLTAC